MFMQMLLMGEEIDAAASINDNEEGDEYELGMQGEMEEEEVLVEAEAEDEEDKYSRFFEGEMDPLRFAEEDENGKLLYEQFQRFEYKTLAAWKRKNLAAIRADTKVAKKQQNIFGASVDEIVTLLIVFYSSASPPVEAASKDKEVTYGSVIKLQHERTKYRLHSHKVPYGSISGHHFETAFLGVEDGNNYWMVQVVEPSSDDSDHE